MNSQQTTETKKVSVSLAGLTVMCIKQGGGAVQCKDALKGLKAVGRKDLHYGPVGPASRRSLWMSTMDEGVVHDDQQSPSSSIQPLLDA